MKKNPTLDAALTRLHQGAKTWFVSRLAHQRHRRLAPITRSDFYRARRILVIRVDGIGDTLMTLPAVRLLRRLHPEARVDGLVRPCSKPLLDELGVFDNIFLYENRRAACATRGDMGQSFFSLRRQLRQQRYDLVIEIAGIPKSRRLGYHAGGKRLVSPRESHYEGARCSSYDRVPSDLISLEQPLGHPTDNFLRLIEQLAGATAPPETRLPVPEAARVTAQDYLVSKGVDRPFVVVHPFSSDVQRNWSPDAFVSVIDHLTRQHGLAVVLTGSERDTAALEAIHRAVAQPEACTLAAGALSILELAAVCQRARLVVCVDTVTLHLADGVGARLVGLVLPWYWLNYPYHQREAALIAPGNQPCYQYMRRPDDATAVRYIDRITVAQVREKIDRALEDTLPEGGLAEQKVLHRELARQAR